MDGAMMLPLAIFALVLTPLVAFVPTQLTPTERLNLAGLSALEIVVEDLDAQEAACGISQANLESTAARALATGNVRVEPLESDTIAFLYLNVVALHIESQGVCVAAVDVSVRTFARGAMMSHSTTPQTVTALLWQRTGIFSGPRGEFGSQIDAAIRISVNQFAALVKEATAAAAPAETPGPA